jgi:hypothetical protein
LSQITSWQTLSQECFCLYQHFVIVYTCIYTAFKMQSILNYNKFAIVVLINTLKFRNQ